MEVEGDSDGPGPGGVWGPWAPSSLPTPAELEWDPAGDVGGLGPLGRRTAWTPGAPCELCGHKGPQGRGQWLEVRAGGVCVSSNGVLLFQGGFCGFQWGPSLSRRFLWLSLPLPLLASGSSSVSSWFPSVVSAFPHFLPLSPIHPTTATLASWLFKYSKYSPISKPPDACPSFQPLLNAASLERPALASRRLPSLPSYFMS